MFSLNVGHLDIISSVQIRFVFGNNWVLVRGVSSFYSNFDLKSTPNYGSNLIQIRLGIFRESLHETSIYVKYQINVELVIMKWFKI